MHQRYSTVHCTPIFLAHWSCFDRDGVCRKLPPTRHNHKYKQPKPVHATNNQLPTAKPPHEKHPIEKKKQTKNTRKKHQSNACEHQNRTVSYLCWRAMSFFADHDNHVCVVLKVTEDKKTRQSSGKNENSSGSRTEIGTNTARLHNHLLLAYVLVFGTAVHLLHNAWCASTGGAINSASTDGAGWGRSCCRVFVLHLLSSAANSWCSGTGFMIIQIS